MFLDVSLENLSQIANIMVLFISLINLLIVGFVYKNINKIKNENNVVVNGDAVFKGSLNVENKIEQKNEK